MNHHVKEQNPVSTGLRMGLSALPMNVLTMTPLRPGHCYSENRVAARPHLPAALSSPSTKLPLTFWFLAIYLITQFKNDISSLNLARHLGISANTALRLKHRLQQTVKNSDESAPFQGSSFKWMMSTEAAGNTTTAGIRALLAKPLFLLLYQPT